MDAAPTAATAATGDADQEIHGDESEIFQDPGIHADEGQEPGEDEIIDSDAEGETAKVARDPKMPSEAEVEAAGVCIAWLQEALGCHIGPRATDRVRSR